MFKLIDPEVSNITIDLDGPDGNAFMLLGYVKSIGKQLDWSKEKITEIIKEMKSSDYANLLKIMYEQIGDYVTIETSNEEYIGIFKNIK